MEGITGVHKNRKINAFLMSQVEHEFALPINEGQHATLLAAKRLAAAGSGGHMATPRQLIALLRGTSNPLLTPSVLDMASVPDGLARAFLNRVRQPRFRYIVPGLSLPPAEVAGFTRIGLEADVIESHGPFPNHSNLSRAPAVVLSGSASRDSYDNAE
ncbi:S-adenosylmethionine synthase protein [Colletotrichum scovillei]|uniref:S-adenosylmethionine synthase protein n=1 Tax=Colletotrichum scovillei TaxID=1209932 RepID=A0A9P7R626_9PEZI|nr:S-adenosylmethionine synthase protein [Colletotrichum scovillei]KAG7065644.1 S-adenosylmethionine synthase protein [Colletotrichum scovillei]KAG7068245.1 S-adenosylmethionine synthase protein [Colletotrichum scovillei]